MAHPPFSGPIVGLCRQIGDRWIATEYKLPEGVRLVPLHKDSDGRILDCCKSRQAELEVILSDLENQQKTG